MYKREDKKTLQFTGVVSKQNELLIDVPLPFSVNSRVKISISIDDNEDEGPEYLAAIAKNPAFKDIFDDSEDIYTLEDGKPFEG